MEHYKYLIIGGGMTADSAVRGIRELDDGNSVGLLSNEAIGPYDRPPLSKGLWKGKDPESIRRKTTEVPGKSCIWGRQRRALMWRCAKSETARVAHTPMKNCFSRPGERPVGCHSAKDRLFIIERWKITSGFGPLHKRRNDSP